MRRLLSNFRRFLANPRGNIAILFGLAVVPVFGIMGVALDYSFANQERTQMQAALDNTALTLSKMMPLSDDDILEQGWKIFNANLGHTTLQYNQDNFIATSASNGKLQLQVRTVYPLKTAVVLSKFFGIPSSMPVSASTEVQWGNTRLRVALVLDNTGSMDDAGKMAALKTATTNLLNQLRGIARDPDDIYVSIIPFSKDVNIGSANYNQDYIYWGTVDGPNPQDPTQSDNNSWDAKNGTCTVSGKTSRSACQSAGTCSDPSFTRQSTCLSSGGSCSISGSGHDSPSTCGTCSISGNTTQSDCTDAGVCSKNPSSNKTQKKCNQAGGTWTAGVWTAGTWTGATWTQGVWTPADHNTWNGCVMDRGATSDPGTAAGYDQKIDTPVTSDNTTLYPAEQFASCTQEIIGLTSDWTSLGNTVTNMQSVGNTNQPIGLVWGWQSLVGGGPLTAPPKDPNYAYSDTIILMSDGLNTQNRWTSTASAIDNRMYFKSGSTISGTCQNIKSSGVQIFTVQVNTGGDPTSTLLQNCATNPSMFFELKSANALITTFDQIGSALANIHLSK